MTSCAGDGGAAFEVRLLGPVQAVHDGRMLELGGMQARSVLAVLLLHPGQVLPRGVIAGNAWSGQPPQTARDLVAHYVSRVRQALAPAAAHLCLESVRPGFRARVDADSIDVHRFTALLRRAERDLAAREEELAIAHLERAVALWRGSTVALEDVEAEWLRARAGVLQEQRLDAVERLAALYCGTGRPERAVGLLRAEAGRHPQRDGLIAMLVRALSSTGASARAVEVADRAIDALDRAGLPVGPRLREARRQAQRPAPAPGSPGAPRQLPPDTRVLTGREQELAQLLQLADTASRSHDGDAGASVVSVIDGMAGIGKTALAVHVGHRVAGRFPDGQLFIDLHGFAQGIAPRTATDALADVLHTLGVPQQQIPQGLEARAALYRDRLASKRMLVVLDNALSEQQIRPLLPGQPGCLVLVTSRRRLKALDEAHTLALAALSAPDAVALLRTLAGPGRIMADDPLLEQIVQLCGYLPLAVRIAAAILRHRATWSLTHLADKLRGTHPYPHSHSHSHPLPRQTQLHRPNHLPTDANNTHLRAARPALAGFHDGDRDLAAVFDLSYTALTEDLQRLFRRLGLHPGPDIDGYTAAALLSTDPDTADRLLQHLTDHNLLTESAPGRYRMHDLIRTHAHARAADDPEHDER